ncbi:hypothetical protein EV122DRAFT_292065 [Schizophyllum commune]
MGAYVSQWTWTHLEFERFINDRLTAYIRTALLGRRVVEIDEGQALIAHMQAVLAFYRPALERSYITALYKADEDIQGLQEFINVVRELDAHASPDTPNRLFEIVCGALIGGFKSDFDQEGRPLSYKSVLEDVIWGPRMVWKNYEVAAAMTKLLGRFQKSAG